jgi:hypothetical protein
MTPTGVLNNFPESPAPTKHADMLSNVVSLLGALEFIACVSSLWQL